MIEVLVKQVRIETNLLALAKRHYSFIEPNNI